MALNCESCGIPLVERDSGRPARFCGTACRVRGYRAAASGKTVTKPGNVTKLVSAPIPVVVASAEDDAPLERLRWLRDRVQELLAEAQARNQGTAGLVKEYRETLAQIADLTSQQAEDGLNAMVNDIEQRRAARRAANSN